MTGNGRQCVGGGSGQRLTVFCNQLGPCMHSVGSAREKAPRGCVDLYSSDIVGVLCWGCGAALRGVCCVQPQEATEKHKTLMFHDAVYWASVTITTVGYGGYLHSIAEGRHSSWLTCHS